jgi:hypothetical protein
MMASTMLEVLAARDIAIRLLEEACISIDQKNKIIQDKQRENAALKADICESRVALRLEGTPSELTPQVLARELAQNKHHLTCAVVKCHLQLICFLVDNPPHFPYFSHFRPIIFGMAHLPLPLTL